MCCVPTGAMGSGGWIIKSSSSPPVGTRGTEEPSFSSVVAGGGGWREEGWEKSISYTRKEI